MKKISVTPISWFEIYKKLPINSDNALFFNKLNIIFKDLAQENPNKCYLYFAEFDFGENIISKGKIVDFENFEFKGNEFAGEKKFKEDLSYSIDPLAIFIEGQGLIVSKEGNNEYPIARINEGDLIGVFGASDMFVYGKDMQEGEENWDLIAGDLSFNLIFDFKDKRFTDVYGTDDFYTNIRNKNQVQTNKELIKYVSELDKKVKVAYFPRHIFNIDSNDTLINHIEVINHILKTSWKQTLSLRSFIFDHSSLNNLIKKGIDGSKLIGYNKMDLGYLLKYCSDVAYGNEYALTFLDDNDEFLNDFKELFNNQFYDIGFEPLLMKNRKITRKNEIRYISMDFPPFLLEESDIDGAVLIEAYKLLIEKIRKSTSIPDDLKERYINLNLKFYHHRGRVDKRSNIRMPDGNDLHKEFNVSSNVKFPKPKGCNNTYIKIESKLNNYFPKYPVISGISEKILSYDLNDFYLISVQHLLRSTGSMFESLIENNFPSQNIYLTGKIYSTHSETKRILKDDLGINLYDYKAKNKLGRYPESMTEVVKEMWNDLILNAPENSNIIILDDGGYCLKNTPTKALKKYNIFGIEQTTSGIKLNKKENKIPIVDVAGSAVKVNIEPSLVSEAINIQLHKKISNLNPLSIGVVGFGHIGKAVAREYFLKGYNINLYDIKKEITTEDIGNYNISSTLESLIYNSDVIIGATGEDITANLKIEDLLETVNTDKTFISVSSGDIEFNFLIQMMESKFYSCEKSSKRYELQDKILKTKNNKDIRILRGGMVANFTGQPDSSPGKYIQITRGILLAAIVQIIENKENILNTKGFVKLSSDLQQEALEIWFNDQKDKRSYYTKTLINNFSKTHWIENNSYGERV